MKYPIFLFNPVGIPGPVDIVPSATGIWLAEDPSSITLETGVKYWDSQINSYQFDKLATGKQPAYQTDSEFGSQYVVAFDHTATQGMDDASFTDNTTDKATLWMVLNHATSNATKVFLEWSIGTSTNTGPMILSVIGGTIRARLKNGSNVWISADWTTSTNFPATILELSYDGTGGAGNISLYEGTTQRANATDATGGINGTLSRLFVGQAANDTLHATTDIPAILVWDDVLTSAQRMQLRDWANLTFGLSVA